MGNEGWEFIFNLISIFALVTFFILFYWASGQGSCLSLSSQLYKWFNTFISMHQCIVQFSFRFFRFLIFKIISVVASLHYQCIYLLQKRYSCIISCRLPRPPNPNSDVSLLINPSTSFFLCLQGINFPASWNMHSGVIWLMRIVRRCVHLI